LGNGSLLSIFVFCSSHTSHVVVFDEKECDEFWGSSEIVNSDEAEYLKYFDAQWIKCVADQTSVYYEGNSKHAPMKFSEWLLSQGKVARAINEVNSADIEYLKSINIASKSDWLKWVVANHPDKGGCGELFQKVFKIVHRVYL
jgi:hypothetical protein